MHMAKETFADTKLKPPRGMSYSAAEKMGLLRVYEGSRRESPSLGELKKFYEEEEKASVKPKVTW